MILVDTSVWVDHFRAPKPQMVQAAGEGLVLHPFCFVEVCLGSLQGRSETVASLHALTWLLPLRQSEVVQMLERDKLFSTGLNFVDLHQLASARVTAGCRIWTRDKRLRAVAQRFGVAADLD